jgi:hypothetical protein
MATTVDLSCAWSPLHEGSTAGGMACRNPAFPYSGKPRTGARSVGPMGVQGRSPGTLFFRQEKKPSVFGFFWDFLLTGGGAL